MGKRAKSRTPTERRPNFLSMTAITIVFVMLAVVVFPACTTATPTPKPEPVTAHLTVSDTNNSAYVDPRALAADPMAYKGKNVFVQGQILNVTQHEDYTWAQIYAQMKGDNSIDAESVVVEIQPKDSRILKNDCWRFYGIGNGTQDITLLLTGATNTVPLLYGYYSRQVHADQYGNCPNP